MDKDILDQAKDDFKRCHDAESSQRKMSEECLKFGILGEQWPETVKAEREREGRPCLTINRLPIFQKQVTNDARMNRAAIHVKPVGDGANQATARIQTDLIRNIWTQSKAEVAEDTALDFASAMGFGYMRVAVDYTCNDSFDQDILIERVANPFSIYGDPDSTSATSEDWNIAFETDWYSKSRFEAKGWKWSDLDLSSFESDGTDEPKWKDGKRVRVAARWTRNEVPTELVRVAMVDAQGQPIRQSEKIMQADEMEKIQDLLSAQGYQVVGTRPTKTYKVKQHIVTGKSVLETNDWQGKYIPIVPMYGEEWNIAGRRYFFGLFNRSMDPQRMFNYWRTASTELVALAPKAPYVGAVGAFSTDAAKWATANVKSHAYVEYDPVPGEPPPQRQAFAGVPAGALQEAMNASDDIKSTMGLFDASIGARSNETSGRAINARKIEGEVATFNFTDNRNRCVEHVGRVVVDLIPQVYNVARILRGIKEDGSTYDVPVNQPVTVQQAPDMGGQEQYQPAEETIEGITQLFDLTVGKYDVVVSAGPSFTTRREETSEQMMEFIRVFPQAAPLIGDLLAKNLDWPGAEQVAERLKAMLPPQAAGQVPPIVQQLQQMLQQQDAQAKEAIGQLQQQIAELQKQVEDKRIENKLKEFDAETKRIGVVVGAAEKGIVLSRDANGDFQVQPIVPQMPMQGGPMSEGMPMQGGEMPMGM
jgi:hypothetical protein